MSLDKIALVLLAGCIVPGSTPAQRPAVRLILPANTSLDTPRPRNLLEPDTLARPNDIEFVPVPAPLPALTPMPTPARTIHPERLNDQLRATFPASRVRLGFVGDRLVLMGDASHANEAKAILELVKAASSGHFLVSHLHVRRQVLLHVLAVEVDRRSAAGFGLPTTNGVCEQKRASAAIASLYAGNRATILVAQTIPVTEGKTAALSARQCQITLCAAASTESISLAVTARFSPSDRCVLAQALQTVVELRFNEALLLTNHSTENERDVLLFVSLEFVDKAK